MLCLSNSDSSNSTSCLKQSASWFCSCLISLIQMPSTSSSMLCLHQRGSSLLEITISSSHLKSIHRVSRLPSLRADGIVAVAFNIHFNTSGQSRLDGLGVNLSQLNYASALYLRCQNCRGKLLRGIESSAFSGASSNG
ncbi:unnamed protein product [Eruca vesicaria subsp. sativa]|uniref:DUF7815 domain-containing protein n=1 Tax=Eruca vesicaria subsp. sativa TaxID=29727 RepID=A0ABC8KEF8_ERUVS|nr:unnamed protein product [Eruca vesicaria subsp. sativa]